MVIWVKIFKTEKTTEMHLVMVTEVCGKVLRIDYCDERLVYLYDSSSGTKGGTYVFNISNESLHFCLSNDIK